MIRHYRFAPLAFILILGIFTSTSTAAPKVDPELTARLASVQGNAQLGVILTFQGSRVTDSQVAAVSALGITTGIRMLNFPIMAVNATPLQIQQMLSWNDLRSIYLNAPLQMNMNQTRPLTQVKAGLLQQRTLANQTYRITVTHYLYDPTEINDIAGLDQASQLKAYRMVYDRIMFTTGGSFRPDDALTRMELGRALMFAARVPQYIPNKQSFTDIAAGTPDALVAESLKFEGVMGLDGATFGPSTSVPRLEQAVALVRALRLDAKARSLANTNVTSGGQVITDNGQIPGPLRGYVQLALDKGLMEAFPAEVRQVAPGQFQALPGPRFEPTRIVKRAEFLNPATKLISLMFGE